MLLAYQEGPQTVAWVAALYGGVQLLEGYVLTPLIEKRAVELPPGVVLVAQAALGVVLGVAGLVLATPLVAGGIALAEGLTASDGAAPPERG